MNEEQCWIEKAFDVTTKLVHECAKNNGWWMGKDAILDACFQSQRELGESANDHIEIALLGLICSEAGEAMEFVRTGDGPDDKLPQYKGVDVELVDVIIRALDLLGRRGAPVGEILLKKLAKNTERGYMHGGKRA